MLAYICSWTFEIHLLFLSFFRPIYQELMLKVSIVVASAKYQDRMFLIANRQNPFQMQFGRWKAILWHFQCMEIQKLARLSMKDIFRKFWAWVMQITLYRVFGEWMSKNSQHSNGDFTSVPFDAQPLIIATYMGFRRTRSIHLTFWKSI